MMKKLLVLAAVGMLTISTAGCQCGKWFRRGACLPVCPPTPTCGVPCDSCTTPGYGSVPSITPGPESYVPAPTT